MIENQRETAVLDAVMSRLQLALQQRVVVEQAKGFLRQALDVSIEDAFTILRSYARAHGQHLSAIARQLMTDRHSRPVLVAGLSEFAARPSF